MEFIIYVIKLAESICEAVWFAWCVFLMYACDKLPTTHGYPI